MSFYFIPLLLPPPHNRKPRSRPIFISSADQHYHQAPGLFLCICCSILNVPVFILDSSRLQDGYNSIISNPRQRGEWEKGQY